MARQCHRATHLASRRHRTARLESRSRQTVPFGVLPRVLSRLLVGAGRHATCLASSLSVVVLSSASARFRHAFAWSAWMRSLECQPRHDSVTIGCFVSFTVYHVWHRAMCDMSFNIDHSMSHEHPVKGKSIIKKTKNGNIRVFTHETNCIHSVQYVLPAWHQSICPTCFICLIMSDVLPERDRRSVRFAMYLNQQSLRNNFGDSLN